MREIRFREEAQADLENIIAYYEEVAPNSLPNILKDIYKSLNGLLSFPYIGQPQPANFRRLVSRKYHFKIAYQVEDNMITVIGIFRYQNRER